MKPATVRTNGTTADSATVPVGRLRNLGPTSARWLEAVGVRSLSDLRSLGAPEAWSRVQDAGFNPTLNLLYALEGALRDEHWAGLPAAVKKRLRAAIE